ncbi:hypothetical protein XENOCAPTIV_014152 [Xenoophorus captivus]|uniref:SAM domain-containing protein n=1 Tax=Xenoophorus captivus TaxID=1517983 RepID=A0ABV0SBD5_9TELE
MVVLVTVDEDSISDWSTDSCGWSDDDFEMDLDVTTPPLSVDSGALDSNDQEIVRCICEVEEENDFMIQVCRFYFLSKHDLLKLKLVTLRNMFLLFSVKIVCAGSTAPAWGCWRTTFQTDTPATSAEIHQWLTNGHMYGLSFLEENYSHQNAKKITTTHQLLGDVHHVVEILNGLQLKMSVLQSSTHTDLRLWQQPWKHFDRPRLGSDSCRGSNTAPSPLTPDEDMSRGEILMSNALEKLSRAATAATSSSSSSSPFPSFQDSYIISEHCYQKPRAYYPAVEQRLVVETRQGSELEDSMRSTEELLEREQRFGALLEMDKPKSAGNSNKVWIFASNPISATNSS